MTPKPQLHERIHALLQEGRAQAAAAPAPKLTGIDAFLHARAHDPAVIAYARMSSKERNEQYFAAQREATATQKPAPRPEKTPKLSPEEEWLVDAEHEHWVAEQEEKMGIGYDGDPLSLAELIEQETAGEAVVSIWDGYGDNTAPETSSWTDYQDATEAYWAGVDAADEIAYADEDEAA